MEETVERATVDSTCWVTLVTRASYLPGVIILAYTLDKQASKYPLVVQYTPSLGDAGIKALHHEAKLRGRMQLTLVEPLYPRAGQEMEASVDKRFDDTFMKLRAFQVYELGYTKAIFLDADMAVFNNPDDAFDTQLPGKDWLGSTHSCICNIDKAKWAPEHWHKGNCAFTPVTGPDGIAADITPESRSTYKLLNGGMFLYYPTQELWEDIKTFFDNSTKLKHYQLPDQDFLADYFVNRWKPMSWKYNAIKTMRYIHPQMWSDDEVAIVHYIIDKPWERKIGPDGVAGHKGRDKETHSWWWVLYKEWYKEEKVLDREVVGIVEGLVATKKPFTTQHVVAIPEGVGASSGC